VHVYGQEAFFIGVRARIVSTNGYENRCKGFWLGFDCSSIKKVVVSQEITTLGFAHRYLPIANRVIRC
jgi:hypothetical protein